MEDVIVNNGEDLMRAYNQGKLAGPRFRVVLRSRDALRKRFVREIRECHLVIERVARLFIDAPLASLELHPTKSIRFGPNARVEGAITLIDDRYRSYDAELPKELPPHGSLRARPPRDGVRVVSARSPFEAQLVYMTSATRIDVLMRTYREPIDLVVPFERKGPGVAILVNFPEGGTECEWGEDFILVKVPLCL